MNKNTMQKNAMHKKLSAVALAICCTFGGSTAALSADRAPVPQTKITENQREDIVFARRNLMAAVGRNMDGITGMVEPGGKIDPADAAEHADEIAVMLLAFSHLFPPGTDNWSAQRERNDPAGVSEASPAVWHESATFRAMARAASQQATDASRAPNEAQFRIRAAALEATCVACHAHFRREEKPYVVPIAPLK